MCLTGPFQFRWLKGYIFSSCYHHQIWSINLKRCYHIFLGCVPEICVTSYPVTNCMYIPGNRDFVFIIIAQFMIIANIRIRFGLHIVSVCLYIIVIVQIYLKTLNLSNACQVYFVECVSTIKHILSIIHYTIYWAVCFQFTNFPCDDWENTCTLSHYHHQIGRMNYCQLFRVRSWNNGMRCRSLYSYGVHWSASIKMHVFYRIFIVQSFLSEVQ